jgi:hypothetical protein
MTDPFRSPEQLAQAFEAGLIRLLEDEGLGAFILVLANLGFEPQLFERFRGPLRARFDALEAQYLEAVGQGRRLPHAEDDLAVFRELMAVGFDALEPTRFRREGPWELQFNPLRAFRPRRMGAVRTRGVRRPFDPAAFHFGKPFLRREILWSGDLLGRPVDLFYNKFPFAPRHGLLVVEPGACRPQYLERADHLHVWSLVRQLGETLPGLGVAYNSYGAYASVNHLHFQLFVRPTPLPVADPRWRHNGGSRPYPVACRRFGSPQQSWAYIEALHAAGTSFNLVYLPDRLYCMPRAAQGSYEEPPWTTGFAWYEVAGGFTLLTREAYESLDAPRIEAELARLEPFDAPAGSAEALPGARPPDD